MINRAAWDAAWLEAGTQQPQGELFARLVRCWSEPQRHYHTLQHLRECLEHFDAVRTRAERPAEIVLALWFHDAFYDPQRHDNEERSADWARDSAMRAGLAMDAAERIHALVMATRHVEMPQAGDPSLLVDVDLSILGAPPDRFDESDRQIREEYAHVPLPQFRERRSHVLQSFLERPCIYSTPHFHGLLEARARENLQRALTRLRAG